MVGLSTILLVVMGIVGYIQFSKPDVAKAAAATPYTETWAATEQLWFSGTAGFGQCQVRCGMPPAGTRVWGYGMGDPNFICDATYTPTSYVTKWSVTGTVGP